MRAYTIALDDVGITYSSMVNGKTDPGALDVEIDLTVASYSTPFGNSFVRVWGVPLSTLANAAQLNGTGITVSAGMAPGLPLANTQPPPGVVVSGTIFQAFGNWEGTEMTLDMIITPGQYVSTQDDPKNLTLHWMQGGQLSDALKVCLSGAFPGASITINISPNLIATETAPSIYQTLDQLNQYVERTSKAIIGGKAYLGVQIVPVPSGFVIYDGTAPPSTSKTLLYTDLIGQPVWRGPSQIQFYTMMRSDISVSDKVVLPFTLVTTTAASQSQEQQPSAIVGAYQVDVVRHVGRFRQPAGNSWLTVFDAHPVAP